MENVNQSNDQLVSGKQGSSRLRAPSQSGKSHDNEVYYEQGKLFDVLVITIAIFYT